MTTTTDPRFVGATAPREIAPPDATAESDAVEYAYLDKLKDLYAHLVTNLSTGHTDEATTRLEHGVALARQARVIALQAIAR